jgi:hypothetical protein
VDKESQMELSASMAHWAAVLVGVKSISTNRSLVLVDLEVPGGGGHGLRNNTPGPAFTWRTRPEVMLLNNSGGTGGGCGSSAGSAITVVELVLVVLVGLVLTVPGNSGPVGIQRVFFYPAKS